MLAINPIIGMESSKIAEYLLKIKAVTFSPDEPYTWASGWKSPIYCDNRQTLSYPEIRTAMRNAFVNKIKSEYPGLTAIAGVATGGIALGALVADALELPMIYIRSKAKGHGLGNMIEGKIDAEGKYVVIEDLVSTGGSSAKAVKALQETGAEVLVTLSIFSYGFPQAEVTFAETGTPYAPLATLADLLAAAGEIGYLNDSQSAAIEEWRNNPAQWRQ